MRKAVENIFGSLGVFFTLMIFCLAAVAVKVLGLEEGGALLYFGMALAADTPRIYELGDINSVPVKASVTIYEGSAVGMTSGYARALNAGDLFAGFAERKADNSATATDGFIRCRVITKGLIKAALTGVAVTDIGKAVYMSDDGTFTLTAGSNSYVGVVHRFVTTDTCIVAFAAQTEAGGMQAIVLSQAVSAATSALTSHKSSSSH